MTNIARIITAVIMIESGGKTNAVGDGGRSIGPAQMRRIQVDEINRILKRKVYTYADRWDMNKSRDMMGIFLTYWVPRRHVSKPADIANLWRNPDGTKSAWYQKKFNKQYKETK